jgi:hypothetical protein
MNVGGTRELVRRYTNVTVVPVPLPDALARRLMRAA